MIQQIVAYEVVCDRCKTVYSFGDGFDATFYDRKIAEKAIIEEGWRVHEDSDICICLDCVTQEKK
jgi:hypothetical protein